jgi:hypothetical protein
MFYNNKIPNTDLFKFYKPFIDNKFITAKFFFLTNNFDCVNNFTTSLQIIKNNPIIIKKNLKFGYKIYNQFRKFLFFKKYSLNVNFKLNSFIKFIYKLNKIQKFETVKFNSRAQQTLFLKFYKFIFFKN